MSIKDRIRNYLLDGNILDTNKAFRLFHTHDLRRIISYFRAENLNVKDKWVKGKNDFGDKVSYKKYWIKKEFKENLF